MATRHIPACRPEVRRALSDLDGVLSRVLADGDVIRALHEHRDGVEIRSPVLVFNQRAKAGAYSHLSDEEYYALARKIENASFAIWNDRDSIVLSLEDVRTLERTMLDLYDAVHKVRSFIDGVSFVQEFNRETRAMAEPPGDGPVPGRSKDTEWSGDGFEWPDRVITAEEPAGAEELNLG